MEKISIIIPIYNSEKYLSRCLNSVSKQTYDNLEILCIDDGSTDKSKEICLNYVNDDNRFKLISKNNGGVSSSRNVGIKNATGEYITFVDSDDWLEFDAIEKMYNCIKKQKVDIVRANYCIHDGNNRKKNNLSEKFINKKYESKDRTLLLTNFFNIEFQGYVWLLMIKKELLNKINLFNEKISCCEDNIFYVDLLLNENSIYFLDEITYNYWKNESSITKSFKNYQKNLNDIISVYDIILDKILIKDLNKEFKKWRSLLATNTIKLSIFLLYLINKTSKKEGKKIIIDFLNEMKKREVIKYFRIFKLPIRYQIYGISIKLRSVLVLKILFKIRNYVEK